MTVKKRLIIVALLTWLTMMLVSCAAGHRTYYGGFDKEFGGIVNAYLMIRDNGTAQIHFAGEKQVAEGTYSKENNGRLRFKFPNPNNTQEYLQLDVEEKQTAGGRIVEGNFHWDFGGSMGIDGKVHLEEYKGQ